MQLRHLEMFVKDPVASLPFYRDGLGFEVEEVQDGRFVWLRSGGASLLLRPGMNAPAPDAYQSAPIAIVLYASDIEAARRRLEDNGVIIRGDDGPGCLTFTDPDGHWFQLVNHE